MVEADEVNWEQTGIRIDLILTSCYHNKRVLNGYICDKLTNYEIIENGDVKHGKN